MPLSEAAVGPVRIAWADAADDRRATSRRLLTELLSSLPKGRETGDDATADEIVQRCPNCGSAGHGPLRTASGRAVVSVSYAGGLAVAAIAAAQDAASLGVDVEVDRGRSALDDLAALFAPQPAPAIRDWTAIEAVVKAAGLGLRIAPDRVRLQRAAKAPWTRRAVLDGTTFHVADAPAPTGFVISVAIVERSGQGRGSAR